MREGVDGTGNDIRISTLGEVGMQYV